MSSTIDARWGFVAALLATAGCGSGGTTPPIEVRFSPETLTASFAQGDDVGQLELEVTLSRPLDGDLYVVAQQYERVIDATRLSVSTVSDTRATVLLFPSCGLSPGTHEGFVSFRLCRDAWCASEYPLTGNRLPYIFTVSEGLRVTAEVDGVAVPGFMTICGAGGLGGSEVISATAQFGVTGGQTLTLTASEPVTWSESVSGTTCFPRLEAVSTTETTWTGLIGAYTTFSKVVCGEVDVHATPVDDPYWQATVTARVISP